MAGINKVIIVGRLGNDPELKYTNQSQAVARLSVATSEEWTDKTGQKQERTEWHRVVVWGKLGELCGKYLSKGRQVYIEGRIQTRSWDDNQGQKKYSTEIVANQVQFLGAGAGDQASGGARHAGASAGQAYPSEGPQQNYPPEPTFDADEPLPF